MGDSGFRPNPPLLVYYNVVHKKDRNMKTLYFCFLLIIGIILWNGISFFNLRYKIKNKKHEIIKLKQIWWADYLVTSLFGLILLGIIYHEIKAYGKGNLLIVVNILVILAVISRLILSGKTVILSPIGIKTSKLIKWDSITKIRRNKNNSTELLIDYNSKTAIIDFYSELKIDELKSKVKVISPETYSLHLGEL